MCCTCILLYTFRLGTTASTEVDGKYVAVHWYRNHCTYPYTREEHVLHTFSSKILYLQDNNRLISSLNILGLSFREGVEKTSFLKSTPPSQFLRTFDEKVGVFLVSRASMYRTHKCWSQAIAGARPHAELSYLSDR